MTDHHNVKSAETLIHEARAAGLTAFPGFEVATADGVHFLCLFDPATPIEQIDRRLGACGVITAEDEHLTSSLFTPEFLRRAREDWGAVTIAAHATTSNGLLTTLQGQARARAWRSPDLLAVAIPGPVEDLPLRFKQIVQGVEPPYRREHPVAVVNARDVWAPEHLAQPGAWTWAKMADPPSIESLRQAFLDPESRVRLATDPPPGPHPQLVAIAWEGGFLDGQALRFNENLNVLIGGRGAGKSTVIESVRYAFGLEPITPDARQAHKSIVRHVLQPGTKVSLLVHSPHPAPRRYLIERTVPGPPVVRDEEGNRLALSPSDVVPHLEVYGQHEIAQLARRPELQARLLERFVQRDDPFAKDRLAALRRELASERHRFAQLAQELDAIRSQLAELPALEEQQARFQEAGLEQKLGLQRMLAREETLLDQAAERLEQLGGPLTRLREPSVADRAFLSEPAVAGMPSRDLLEQVDQVLADLSGQVERAVAAIDEQVGKAVEALAKRFSLPPSQARALASLPASDLLAMEAIELGMTATTLTTSGSAAPAGPRAPKSSSGCSSSAATSGPSCGRSPAPPSTTSTSAASTTTSPGCGSRRPRTWRTWRAGGGSGSTRTGCRAARNQLLKDVMRDYGYLEHMRMGVPRKIIRGMREHNGTEPDLIEDGELFTVRLRR